MHRDPAVPDGGFNRCAIFLIAAAGRSKLPIDDLDRQPSGVIGLKPICNFEQLRRRRFRIGERVVFFEFHVPYFRSYLASASALASACS